MSAARVPALPAGLTFLRRLGESPLSEVLLVRDDDGERYALKILRASVSGDERLRERWRREAALLEELQHPNLVRSYGAIEVEGRPALLLEYVDGPTLRAALEDGPLGWEQAARYGVQVARALDRLHRHGAVHRDVKPHNVLLHRRRGAVLADLGLVRRDEDPTLTRQGAALGSPAYMSPEQARDPSDVDQQADIYSLGATLHHALSGSPPFLGGGVGEVIHRVMHEDPEPLPDEVPEALQRVLATALEKEPERRYVRARDLGADLGRVLLGYPPRLYTRYRLRRRRAIAAAAGAALLLGVSALLWWPRGADPAAPDDDRPVAAGTEGDGEAAPAVREADSGGGAPTPGLPDAAAWFADWAVGTRERFDAALRRDRYREALAEVDALRRRAVPQDAPAGFVELRRAWIRAREDEVHARAETQAVAALGILDEEVRYAETAVASGVFDGTVWEEEVRGLWREAGLYLADLPLRAGGPDPHARLQMNRALLDRRSARARVRVAIEDVPAVRADVGRLLRGGHFAFARARWMDADPVVFEHSAEARSDLARIDELIALERRLEARLREQARSGVSLRLARGGTLEGELLPVPNGGFAVDYLDQEEVPVRLLMLDADWTLEWLQAKPEPWLAAQLRWCQGDLADAVRRMEAVDPTAVPEEWNPEMWTAEWRAALRERPEQPGVGSDAAEGGDAARLAEAALLQELRKDFPDVSWSIEDGDVLGDAGAVALRTDWEVDLRRVLRGWKLVAWELRWSLPLEAAAPRRLSWLDDVRLDRDGRNGLPEMRVGGGRYEGYGVRPGQGMQSLRWSGGTVELDGVTVGRWEPSPVRLQLRASADPGFELTGLSFRLRRAR